MISAHIYWEMICKKKLNAPAICARRRLKRGQDFVKAVNHW